MDMQPSLRTNDYQFQPLTVPGRVYIACNQQHNAKCKRQYVEIKRKTPSLLPPFTKPHNSVFQCAQITLHSNSRLANLPTSILFFLSLAMSQLASPGNNSGTYYLFCTRPASDEE